MLSTFISFIILPLPSKLKIFILRMQGASIGKGCKIGFSIIHGDNIKIGDYVYIGHFNLLWRLNQLNLETGSAITMFNWITGAKTGSFHLGRNSGITRFHFFEGSGGINIGKNSIIAGRNSHFFTHGISPDNLDDIRGINIGDWSYIGSGTKFVPGSAVAEGTFVGMGSVVTKAHEKGFTLLVGVPAFIKKDLSKNQIYFSRKYLHQSHHPKNYQG